MACLPEKLLIVGDVDGNFDELFKKVNKIFFSHGSAFNSLIVCGNFFGPNPKEWQLYLDGEKEVPLDTYILGPQNRNQLKKYYPNYRADIKYELAKNVKCLGKLGVFVTPAGLTIAYISGFESKESNLWSFTEEDALALVATIEGTHTYKPIDIFITPQWPKDITTEFNPKNPSSILQRVIKTIVPRYIFCATEDKPYKRIPYNNDAPYAKVLTRFIALGNVKSKGKSLHALELSKDIPELKKPLLSVVPSPYINIKTMTNEVREQYRWDLKRNISAPISRPLRKKKKLEEAECWFCLSSPKVERHLVISLGHHVYVALAKGGLVPRHMILSTITHVKHYYMADYETKIELKTYKLGIRNLYRILGCSAVFFERNLKSTLHLQIDAVPILPETAYSLRKTFDKYAAKYDLKIEWYEKRSLFPGVREHDEDMQYFLAELPTQELLFIRNPKKFPLLFGRYVLADSEILNVPERVNWRECCKTKEEEIAEATEVKEEFKKVLE